MRVALVNTNRMQPPIAPIGLEYVAEALAAAGHEVQLLDLCWEADPQAAIERFFNGAEFGLVGVTLRNTDDCGLPKSTSFLPDLASTVAAIRRRTSAPVVLGGMGFSVMPERVLELAGAELGVWGEGEFAIHGAGGEDRAGRGMAGDAEPGLAARLRMETQPAGLPSPGCTPADDSTLGGQPALLQRGRTGGL